MAGEEMLKEKIIHIEHLSINSKFSFQCQIKTMTYFFLIKNSLVTLISPNF